MRKILLASMLVLVGMTSIAADKNQDVFSELDGKIAGHLAREKWHYASRTFVRIVWEDYKRAHLELPKDVDVVTYDGYVGSFRRADKNKDFITISKSESGRYFVALEGHRIPAVARKKRVIFTTGDVVYSSIPTFANKPYCTLEIFIVRRVDGKYFLARPRMPRDRWVGLSRVKEKD